MKSVCRYYVGTQFSLVQVDEHANIVQITKRHPLLAHKNDDDNVETIKTTKSDTRW